jgi:hypothetical protein
MGAIRTSAESSVRDYETAGVPASGLHEPVKSAIRGTFGVVEDQIDIVSAVANAATVGVLYVTPVRVRSTGNVVIATALENGDTLNGITLATGNRVFLGSQTAPAENGVYVVAASGAASRATDADTAAELARIAFVVKEGTVGAGERWTLPLASSAITVGTTALNFVQIGVEVDVAADVAALETAVGAVTAFGWDTLVNTGTDTPSDYTIMSSVAEPADGYVTRIRAGADDSAGLMTVFTATLAGTNATLVRSVKVLLIDGVADLDIALQVSAGEYVGVTGGNYKFQNGVNPTLLQAYTRSGAVTTASAVTLSTSHRYEVNWEVSSGVTGTADAALQGPVGFTPEAATKTLAQARNGIWGPGAVTVSSERFFITPAPSLINLYDGMRSATVEHSNANDVLTLIGDSISHFATATTGPEHWFNQLTRFSNSGIASDEPIMTALRPSSTYVTTFYGVTVTGGSTGTAGPLGESLILADGDYFEFTGTYESVGAWYEQKAAQGSLVISRGGTTLATLNAAGSTETDKFSAVIATGVTTSATYRFAASGGPVDVTGLLRLGVKAAGSAPRLRTMRAARGSFTFANFGSTQRAAIIKQATYAGGVILPIIALGINDAFSTAPATIVTNATALIDALQAAGAPRIYAIPPMRPTSDWDSSFTGGRTFDGAAGPLRKLYRQRGVVVIQNDMLDWNGRGLFADGLHPNQSGQPFMAQLVVQGIIDAANKT